MVSILPRLKPSQFDSALWPYEEALTAWGQAWDQAAAAGEAAPPWPEGVPAEAGEAYQALFAQSRLLAESLASLAEDGVLDQVIIGQDDAEKWCPSNIIYRALKAQENENLTLIHGADELSMLLVARAVNPAPEAGVNIIYTNPDKVLDIYPYEAAPLAEMAADKLALAGLRQDPEAPCTCLLYTSQPLFVLHKRPKEPLSGWRQKMQL